MPAAPIRRLAPSENPNRLKSAYGQGGIERRGRPKGSKNKVKLSPTVLTTFKDIVGPYLPPEDLQYLLSSLEGKEERDFERDLFIFIGLQLKAVLPVVAREIESGTLTREATQRSATVKELLALWLSKQKQEKNDGNTNVFIQNLLVERGFDADRLALLLGSGSNVIEGESRLLSGNADDDAGTTDEAGTVSDQVFAGQEQIPSGSQESADRL